MTRFEETPAGRRFIAQGRAADKRNELLLKRLNYLNRLSREIGVETDTVMAFALEDERPANVSRGDWEREMNPKHLTLRETEKSIDWALEELKRKKDGASLRVNAGGGYWRRND